MTSSSPDPALRPLRLVSIEFETTLGAVYTFPDMAVDELERFLRGFTRDHDVTLVNISRACLVVPSRIVSVIRVEGEERWRK